MKAHINLMQNSALNFSVLIDHQQMDVSRVKELLGEGYHIRYNENLELVTIRHYNDKIIEEMSANKTCLVLQKTRTTVRLVLQSL